MLSFSIGHRNVPDSRSQSKRDLKTRQYFQQSQLSSVLGRESRVLKRIYQRIETHEKKEGQPGG